MMESKILFLLVVVCAALATGQENRNEPCSLDDFDCIRDYFANTNQCTRTSAEDGEPIRRDLQVSYLPKFNVTIICIDDIITFFGSAIEQFYVNEETNNLVMTVNFDGINIYTDRANFVIHKRGEEPTVVEDFVNVTYSAAITAIIPNAGERGVAGAAVTSFNTVAVPPFAIGPKVTDSSDETVSNFFNALVGDIPTAVQELLLTKAPYFFYIYLQEYICNYGIEFTGEIIN